MHAGVGQYQTLAVFAVLIVQQNIEIQCSGAPADYSLSTLLMLN
jgi:hypothetical protein